METRAHHVLIGLFTVIVVTGALLFGLWLAKSSVDTEFKDYEVVFNEAVSGLSKGSPCSTAGSRSATWCRCAWTRKTRAGCWRGFAWVATPRSRKTPRPNWR
jgi:hypothetical protein